MAIKQTALGIFYYGFGLLSIELGFQGDLQARQRAAQFKNQETVSAEPFMSEMFRGDRKPSILEAPQVSATPDSEALNRLKKLSEVWRLHAPQPGNRTESRIENSIKVNEERVLPSFEAI